ncbi:MAG: glycosyltransferase, partial [Bacteroidota bacterium]|nr:glycosyltransferase [Bacteroidota bacterium]
MADKIKLFLIINRLVLGGNTADAVSLAHRLSGKYNITIVYGEKETDEIEVSSFIQNYPEITFIKIPSLHRAIHPFYDAKAYRRLLLLLKKHRPQIVHTHGFKSGLLGRWAARKTRVPVIIHTYHGHLFHSYYNRFVSSLICLIEKRLATFTTGIIAISPQQAFELTEVYRIAPASKISTIYLGIDKNDYPLSGNGLRKQYNIPDDVIIIAIIGRLVPIKNHSLFIKIAEQIVKEETKVCFFIIGDGYKKRHIQKGLSQRQLAWQEGTEQNKGSAIYFTSWITNIASSLNDIDIVLLTSLNEGTPVSLLEAQLFGKPVVTTNTGGVRDSLLANETGFLIPNFCAEEAVKQLKQLIDDKALR